MTEIWDTFDGLFKRLEAQERRIEELEARAEALERRVHQLPEGVSLNRPVLRVVERDEVSA